ncbi:MAG: DUF1553 domain-containing protein [Fimbriimonas sp.]
MKAPLPVFVFSLGVLGYAVAPTPQKAPPVNFNREVKPILSEHCFKCHGPDAASAAAGLRLDSFEAATKRGINPGNPDLSRILMRATHSDSKLRMPPKDSGMKPLTPAQIDILRRWIEQGAKYEEHWSFVPPKRPLVPPVSDFKWCRNFIDRYVLARMDEAKLKPEPEAEPEILAMRAALTLTGLPPSDKDLAAFRADKSEGAYERFVDRLLASPQYGEHQARYWLDAVRYGDTHGLHLDNERGIYPYRDWVVRAYNQDLPFNKFTEWQLAGDMLERPTKDQLIATGYVRMNPTTAEGGAIEEEFLAKNTFDRVDTTSTVFLGLTVACARCHDHKYDPIPQKDYYRLYAFFNSTTDKPLDDNALLPPPVTRAGTDEDDARLAAMDAELADRLKAVDVAKVQAWLDANKQPTIDTKDWQVSPQYKAKSFDEAFATASPGEPGQPAPAWKPLALKLGVDATNVVGAENAAVYVRGTIQAAAARTVVLGVSSDDGVRVWLNGKLIHDNKALRGVTTAIDSVKAELKAGHNEIVFKVVNATAGDGLILRVGDARQDRMDKALAALTKAPQDPKAIEEARLVFLEEGPASEETTAYRNLKKARADLDAQIPMTLIAQEMMKPRKAHVLRRGEYNLIGEEVGRAVPSALGGKLPNGMPANRLGLAKWLTSPSNPLVARVFVNRMWQQHFGTGIVKTSEDFGSQGEWPTNPELLDFLAVNFIENGWSVKKLNRLIVTSAAFRQSSRATKAKLEKDPENRLIARGPRYRLDAEVIRDRALAAGGLLVDKPGGKGFKPYQPDGIWEAIAFDSSNTAKYTRDKGDAIYRRSLYLFWKRTSPHPVMMNFDAPMREACTVRRFRTNTPLQALTTLNEPAFLEASRTMAERILRREKSDEARLQAAYLYAFGRAPRPAEVSVMRGALARYREKYGKDAAAAEGLLKVGDAPRSKSIPASEHAAWMLVCSTLMNTDEFLTQH